MSAIGGIWRRSGLAPQADELSCMIAKLRWMGPDHQGQHSDQQAGVIQCTHAATPLPETMRAPLTCPWSGCIIAADCRLDNRDELVNQLASQTTKPQTDIEILLAAYHQWGEATPSHLLGDFAFALWDPRKRHFFCARDHMGVRPFYYHYQSDCFACASNPSALLALPGISRQPNEQQIARYLLQLIPEEHETFYSAIACLPAGHQLTATPEQLQVRQYWSPMQVATNNTASFEDNAEEFASLFTEAVRCRTEFGQNIGSTLSGGLDSSSITCVLNELFNEGTIHSLHTYSAIFPSVPEPQLASIDERKHINWVRQHCQPIAHDIEADRLNPFSSLATDVATVGQPFFGPNMYIHDAMYQRAIENKTPIFFDGTDGDSVLSYGFEHLPALLGNGRFPTLLGELRSLKKVSSSRQSLAKLFLTYSLKPILKAIFNHSLPAGGAIRNISQERQKLLQPDFAQRNDIRGLIQTHLKRSNLPTLNASSYHKASLALPHLSHVLEIQAMYAAKHGIHLRLPFLDMRLVEFCLSLRPEHKLHQGWSRAVQRAGMRSFVPKQILHRIDKGNLGPNFYLGVNNQGPQVMQQMITPVQPQLNQYLRTDILIPKYSQHCFAQKCTSDRAIFLYSLANFSCWLH